MTLRFHPALFASLLTLTALGCDGAAPGADANGVTEVVKSSLAREAPAPGAEVAAAEDLAQFGWGFYDLAADTAHNFVYSPYSISVATAMLSAGAEGETLSQMQAALRFRSTGTSLHKSQNALSQALAQRNHAASADYNAQSLRVSNDFWMLPDLSPTNEFLDPLAQYYGADVHLTPFDAHPEESRQAINAKVGEDTGGLIPELLPKGSIAGTTVFVLTDALYFKGSWAKPFNELDTQPAAFHDLGGAQSTVPMMHKVEEFPYVAGDGFVALSLPYERDELEMVILVPDDFMTFQATLTADDAAQIQANLQTTPLSLGLPKFAVKSTIPLKAELQAAGMVDAFKHGIAQFPHIENGIFLSDAFHQTRIVVDEKGTEAAAATAYVGSRHSLPPDPPVPVTVDRPFIYWIRDVQTNAVLFFGHYVRGG